MLTLATLAMSVDATDNPIAMLYPPVVAVAGVLAFLTVDRTRASACRAAWRTCSPWPA